MAPVGCEVVLNKDALFNLGACWLYKWNSQVFLVCVAFLPEQKKKQNKTKTAAISRRYHWLFRDMTSEKRVQKFHTDDVVEANFLRGYNQSETIRSG